MTIDEAIKHCKEMAELNRDLAEVAYHDIPMKSVGCLDCAKEHEQLAEWLEELKARREADNDKNN